jgi:hypothetical protein
MKYLITTYFLLILSIRQASSLTDYAGLKLKRETDPETGSYIVRHKEKLTYRCKNTLYYVMQLNTF